jgi:hypothetical protein
MADDPPKISPYSQMYAGQGLPQVIMDALANAGPNIVPGGGEFPHSYACASVGPGNVSVPDWYSVPDYLQACPETKLPGR